MQMLCATCHQLHILCADSIAQQQASLSRERYMEHIANGEFSLSDFGK